jgi:hypothetical protein
MRENRQLAEIASNMPDYAKVRGEFFENYPVFLKLGSVNYVALAARSGSLGGSYETVLAVYLCGLAAGRAQEISEQGDPDHLNPWNPLGAWALVQAELTAIMPDIPRLPAPAEVKIPRRRKQA